MSSSTTVTIPESNSAVTSQVLESNTSNIQEEEKVIPHSHETPEPTLEPTNEVVITESVSEMLNEAMGDNHERRSEGSGSSKSYEVVKGDFTSGHTSGDELETNTTSSDIEVIASPTSHLSARTISPNRSGRFHPVKSGYSSNGSEHGGNGSRISHAQAPRTAGHTRTSSEISAVGSEESFSQIEADRLLRRITELSEVLEARESKLVEMSKANLELQEKNTDLSRLALTEKSMLTIS
jgi:hypothetical protein